MNESDEVKIGLNRQFLKGITINAKDGLNDYLVKESSSEISSLNPYQSIQEKYANSSSVVIFDDSLEAQTNRDISYENLIDVLTLDENSFDSFISQTKGEFISSFPPHKNNNAVQFESRFESGNLRLAIQTTPNQFDLILKNDINSGKTYQWFYFNVQVDFLRFNSSKITFNIINCEKNDLIFSKGLKVLLYDCLKQNWTRAGENITYSENDIVIADKKHYTLSFTIDLPHQDTNSQFYLAYCYPYTYTDLQRFLTRSTSKAKIESILKLETIGRTMAGNNLYQLTVTNFESSEAEISKRPIIYLTSRVHPGESNSSYVIEGAIEFVLSLTSPYSHELRCKYIFIILPMLNPDGVINGNFRCDITGKDLNRMWMDPRITFAPTIYYTKESIIKTKQTRDVYLYCDFHGHSKKSNFFLYSCKTINDEELVLNKLMEKRCQYFDQSSCVYRISPQKVGTGRAVVKNELGINFSYCLESSIGFISKGEEGFFTILKYKQVGRDFMLSLLDMSRKSVYFETLTKVQLEVIAKKKKGKRKKKKIVKQVEIKEAITDSKQSIPLRSMMNIQNELKDVKKSYSTEFRSGNVKLPLIGQGLIKIKEPAQRKFNSNSSK